MLTWRLGLAVEAVAVACGVVAFVGRNRERGGEIEGAYFNRSVNGGGGTFSIAPDEFDVLDPYLWLGSAVALAAVGAALLVVLAFRARRTR
jgi:hypothetical protein